MPYIDYLDPSRAGDLNYQRQQRTAALDRELGYDISGYGGNQQKIQARGEKYGRDVNYMNRSLQDAGLDPFYDRNAQAARNVRQANQGLASQRALESQQTYTPQGMPQGGNPDGGGWGAYQSPTQTSAMFASQRSKPANSFVPPAPRYSDALAGNSYSPAPRDTGNYSTKGQAYAPYQSNEQQKQQKYRADSAAFGAGIANRNWTNAGYGNAPDTSAWA